MRTSRRSFLKYVTTVASVLIGGTQLSGCLGQDSGQSDPAAPPTAAPPAQPDAATAVAPATQSSPVAPAPAATSHNGGPVWQPAPTVEFVEGVPAVVSVRQFVQDPNNDPLVIALHSGALIPGLTWNPTNSTITYDGRPLGAKDQAPVVVSGVVFTADDRKG